MKVQFEIEVWDDSDSYYAQERGIYTEIYDDFADAAFCVQQHTLDAMELEADLIISITAFCDEKVSTEERNLDKWTYSIQLSKTRPWPEYLSRQ